MVTEKVITGVVIRNSINKKGEKSSAVEFRDAEYTSLDQTITFPFEFALGAQVKVTVEEVGE